jgi:predicted PolB exonuclease-like 3'-5' exonuclease
MRYALFDIETRIDWELVEAIEDCSRERYLEELRESTRQSQPFIPHFYHLPISIALGIVAGNGLDKLGSLPGPDSKTLATSFWNWLMRFQGEGKAGVLVSFNGRGFDIPVLEVAALRYGIPIPQHFKGGNRYRFQTDCHVDVMDLLANYGASRAGGLSMYATIVGLPPKQTHGGDVEALYQAGEIEKINRYCRNDVRRLYAVWARLQLLRGLRATLPELPELEEE